MPVARHSAPSIRRPGRPPRSARRPPPREALLEAADRLFYRGGVAATGVDGLAKAARVSKVSIYQIFGGKADLAAAYVERRTAGWRDWFATQMRDAPPVAVDRLLFVFDVVGRFVDRPEFCGCAFIRAAVDDRRPGRRVGALAWRAKRETRADLTALAQACGAVRPQQLAEQLALLIDGALVAAMMGGPEAGAFALQAARSAAERLIAGAARHGRHGTTP